ncbi:hypothetical protein HPP92_020304 [Vanilla planifolia]|uniref:EF-hand domain-containing protein n=1 Tax=Vanilla planifolia TaxID=51239 RepID=A0A835UHR7_VANPL|nr:hypothetical protein HPP92_020304 [Vanilla planifolia]
MSQTDIQKYTKVFIEVDKDRDGKITGEEARNLFLSWRLPREVLKQVWDLADQDSDIQIGGQAQAHEQGSKIMDSKEKIEYYRSKMQELVLYKSRCDNKLNEITERASADKHEVESLAKKYVEKYKQVAEVASKLTIEDAALREIQVRKSELQNAIVNMEKGGSADGLLQVRADRIQSELEELVKALHDRSKHHGLNIKSTATIDLPIGWQPGIAEGAVDWDEDWDKFEDEGFSIVKDLSAEKGYDSNRSNSQSQVLSVPTT